MKYILFILCVGFIVFSSCDGRISKRDSLKQSVSQFKDSVKPVEIVEYVPKAYSEVKTDTILSNGFRVIIKNSTSMDASIMQEFNSNNIKHKHYFRQITSEITVYKNEKLIFKSNLNDIMLQNNVADDIAFEDYLNNGTSIDEMASLEQNKLVLNTSYYKPKQTVAYIYRITIDSNGHCDLKKIDYART